MADKNEVATTDAQSPEDKKAEIARIKEEKKQLKEQAKELKKQRRQRRGKR